MTTPKKSANSAKMQATKRTYRPKDRITDNTEEWRQAMVQKRTNDEARPADYDLGPVKLDEFRAFRRLAIAALVLASALTLYAILNARL